MFTTIFEMYNLVSIIQREGSQLGSVKESIIALKSDLSKNIKDTFTSKRTLDDSVEDGNPERFRGGRGGQEGNTSNGERDAEEVFYDRHVVDAFTRAGYMLESNDEDENGWAPLDQVSQPSTMSVDLNF